MHRGIKAYLDGKIFLAPLENPRIILDIGYGTLIFAFEPPRMCKCNMLIHRSRSPQNRLGHMARHIALSSDSTS